MGISDLHGQSAGGEARALLISDGISTVRVGKLVVGWPAEGWGRGGRSVHPTALGPESHQ